MRNPLADIRPQERRPTAVAFLTLFGILAGHALLETARDTLFLSSLPYSRLAFVYLGVAVVALGLFAAQDALGKSGTNRRAFALWLAGSAAVTLAFWLGLPRAGMWALYALYIWSAVFATLIVVRFWTLAAGLFTVVQAKRVFTVIGAGSVLGAVAGSAAAGILLTRVDARHLLAVSSVILAATASIPALLLPAPAAATAPADNARRDVLGPLRDVRRHPFLRRVAAIVLLAAVTFTLVDFVFKSGLARSVPPHQLGEAFAWSYAALNAVSLAAQLLVVGWVVRTLSVDRVLSVQPALMGAAGLLVAVGGGVWAALALKLFDGALRHSLHRTATEVLYVPLAPGLRDRAKAVIDVAGQRGGQALASVLILGAVAAGRETLVLGLVTAGCCALWIATARTLKGHYLDLFRETLSEVSLNTRFRFPELNLESLESLIGALNSSDDARVVAAMDLLDEQDRVGLIPALILYHPASPVVLRALELFAKTGRRDFLPLAERLLERDDPEVRAALLRALSWVGPRPDLLRRLIADPSPIVQATALIGSVSFGVIPRDEAEDRMLALAGSGSTEEKLALCRAIRYSPGAAYEGILLVLAETADNDVKLAAARAMREIRSPNFIPTLLAMLPDRALRGEAREALVSIGSEGRERLEEALGNPHLNEKIRAQIPRTIAEFEPQVAADILMRHLRTGEGWGVRYRILKALARLRSRDRGLRLDRALLMEVLRDNLGAVFRILDWRSQFERGNQARPERATQVQGLILSLLQHKEAQAVERTFRLLGLLHPEEDVYRMYRGVRSRVPAVRASSLELLENLLAPDVREPFLAALDDVPPAQRLARAGGFHRRRELTYEALLRELLERRGVGLRTLVIYHIGELGIRSLRDALTTLPSDLGGLVSREVERTLRLLSTEEAV